MNIEIIDRESEITLVFACGYMFGAWVYKDVIKFFPKYNIVVLDEIGSCQGEMCPFNQEAEKLHELLVVRKYDKAVLVGHSMGGFFAQRFVANYCNNVIGLILVATCNPSDFSNSYRLREGDVLTDLFSLSVENFVTMSIFSLFSKRYLADKDNFIHVKENISQTFPQMTVCRNQLEATQFESEYDSLVDFQEPPRVLVMAPVDDRVIPIKACEGLKRKYPSAEVKLIEGEHMFFFESPEYFGSFISQWVCGVLK